MCFLFKRNISSVHHQLAIFRFKPGRKLTEYVVELIQVVFPREDGPVGHHLSQDAAHGPDVNGLGVALDKNRLRGGSVSFKKKETFDSDWARARVPGAPTFELSMISGARYQRVATYSVRKPVWSCSGSAIRARPKSQIWGRRQRSEVKHHRLRIGLDRIFSFCLFFR